VTRAKRKETRQGKKANTRKTEQRQNRDRTETEPIKTGLLVESTGCNG